MPATSKAGRIRRAAGLPVDAKAVRDLQTKLADRNAEEEAHRQAVVEKVLSRQNHILEAGKAAFLNALPEVIKNILKYAKGEAGTPGVQLDAGKYVIDRVSAQGLNGLGGAPLAELPLDQLEQVLSSALDSTRQVRAIQSTSQRVDSTGEELPDLGSDASQPGPASSGG